jgi:hypothetical protein
LENTGNENLVIWAFGNRFRHEVCVYPDQGVAFVEGLGADVPLDRVVPSSWTEERRKNDSVWIGRAEAACDLSPISEIQLPTAGAPLNGRIQRITGRYGQLRWWVRR